MKTVCITGASRGIGKACALYFAQQGFSLILTCHKNLDLLEDLQAEIIKEYKVPCLISAGDLCDESYVNELFVMIQKECGSLDILVNNAGISHIGLLQDMSLNEWKLVLHTNLTSVFLCCRTAIPLFLRQHSGSIVNVSSVWGNTGASCETAYSASKGGINAFTRALAKELAPSNIRVNAAAFGAIDTEMNAHLTAEERKSLEEEIPMERYGTPQEAAELIFQIACAPEYLTGQVITMDGGWI